MCEKMIRHLERQDYMKSNNFLMKPESKQSIAYNKLKNMIIQGELPENRFLIERQLSEMLNISRTPVRAALNELCSVGLITYYPGSGYMVSSVKIEDVVEIYQIRTLLDEMAFRDVLITNNPDVINELFFHVDAMEEYFKCGNNARCAEHDMLFHDCYYLNTHNKRLSKLLFSLRDQIRRFLLRTVTDDERIMKTCSEHRQIMNAVSEGNIDGACELLVEHLNYARDYHLNKIQNFLKR
jgi:DNA-binding GntR family transcriptional regulator